MGNSVIVFAYTPNASVTLDELPKAAAAVLLFWVSYARHLEADLQKCWML